MELKANWENIVSKADEITYTHFEDIRKYCWALGKHGSEARTGWYVDDYNSAEDSNNLWKEDYRQGNEYTGYFRGETCFSNHKYRTSEGWVTQKRKFLCIMYYNHRKPPLYKSKKDGWVLLARHDNYCDFAYNSGCYCYQAEELHDPPAPYAPVMPGYKYVAYWGAAASLPPQFNKYTQKKWFNSEAEQPAEAMFGREQEEPVEFSVKVDCSHLDRAVAKITGHIGAQYPDWHNCKNPPQISPGVTWHASQPWMWSYHVHKGLPPASGWGSGGGIAVDSKIQGYQSYIEALLDDVGKSFVAWTTNPEIDSEDRCYQLLSNYWTNSSIAHLGCNNSAFDYVMINSLDCDWYLSTIAPDPYMESIRAILRGDDPNEWTFTAVWRPTWKYSFGYPDKAYLDPHTGKPLIWPGYKGFPPLFAEHRYEFPPDGFWTWDANVNMSWSKAVAQLTDEDRDYTRGNREPEYRYRYDGETFGVYEMYAGMVNQMYDVLTKWAKRRGLDISFTCHHNGYTASPNDHEIDYSTNANDTIIDKQYPTPESFKSAVTSELLSEKSDASWPDPTDSDNYANGSSRIYLEKIYNTANLPVISCDFMTGDLIDKARLYGMNPNAGDIDLNEGKIYVKISGARINDFRRYGLLPDSVTITCEKRVQTKNWLRYSGRGTKVFIDNETDTGWFRSSVGVNISYLDDFGYGVVEYLLDDSAFTSIPMPSAKAPFSKCGFTASQPPYAGCYADLNKYTKKWIDPIGTTDINLTITIDVLSISLGCLPVE